MLHTAPGGEVVKILDFGIAKLIGEEWASVSTVITANNIFVGTAVYIAPERFIGEKYDGRSDVYSAGILLHEMLTGQLPFSDREQHIFKVMFNHLHGNPTPLRVHAPELPERLEALILRMLARDKEARPTAQQLLPELLAFLPADADATSRIAAPGKTKKNRQVNRRAAVFGPRRSGSTGEAVGR